MADVLAVRDEYRAQNCALLIQECNSSGLSNREFCKQRRISEKTSYYWLRKLRSQMAEADAPQLVHLEPSPAPIQNDVLQIQYRAQNSSCPRALTWMHSPYCCGPFSYYDRSGKSPQLLHRLRLIPIIFLSSSFRSEKMRIMFFPVR